MSVEEQMRREAERMRGRMGTQEKTAPLNLWIYYKNDDDKVERVQGGVFIDHWLSSKVLDQLNGFVTRGILTKAGWVPGSRIVRIEKNDATIDVTPTSGGLLEEIANTQRL